MNLYIYILYFDSTNIFPGVREKLLTCLLWYVAIYSKFSVFLTVKITIKSLSGEKWSMHGSIDHRFLKSS